MDLSLGDLLFLFKRKIIESTKKESLKNDLTFSQMEILNFIGISGKKTMKEIADHLKITPPSATVMIEEMEKKSMVKRVKDKKDRRIVFIILSEKTKKLFDLVCKKKNSIFKEMISKLTKKDQKEFERIIKIIITE